MQTIVVIPARLASTRLPRKLLLPLGEKSILQRVYEQCLCADGIDAVYIATDSPEIATACQHFTTQVIMTDQRHTSGTDRIAQAIESLDCHIVVNVQGDEPFISPALITEVAQTLECSGAPMSSAMQRIASQQDLHDPNVVKVVVNHHREALYFSRAPIPLRRDDNQEIPSALLPATPPYYKHIGIYGYTKSFLQTYTQMPPSILEQAEKLEQLRVLENGYTIQMIETTEDALGIDTPEDYEKALALLHKEHPNDND